MLVSIGIPFYNNESTLADAIRSVFAQTCQEWELILVDDGSFDKSLDIAKAVKDPRVRVISDGLNKGLSNRLNQITTLASGKYIARMDADDLMHPYRIKQQVEYLDAHPDVDLLGTGIYSINSLNEIVGSRGLNHINTASDAVLRRGLFIHPSVTGRAKWFRENTYSEQYIRAEDYELWLRTSNKSKFRSIQSALMFYREEQTNIKKYLKSNKCQRKIIWNYGPKIVGYLNTTLLIFLSHLKGFIYSLFTLIGKQNWLINKRNSQLSEEERKSAERILNQILTTQI